MANKIGIPLTASELADALGLVHVGKDLAVEMVSPATVIAAGSLFFSKAPVDTVCAEAATGIVSEASVGRIGAALISRNPRLILPGLFAGSSREEGSWISLKIPSYTKCKNWPVCDLK